MAITSDVEWDTFIHENLIQHGIVNGVALITRQCQIVYSYGSLQDLEQSNWEQFGNLFFSLSPEQDQPLFARGFNLPVDNEMKNFKIYKKTNCSIYATSHGNKLGLIVCNLPYGVLICTYGYPHTAGIAVKHVEQFSDLLRR
ncbi:uncharacterized protein [Ptychodera flava]|uniref:uncharacterized protein n=1 Tax=Ptychodera flava TaxID=63121 RepID=UPI003969D80A